MLKEENILSIATSHRFVGILKRPMIKEGVEGLHFAVILFQSAMKNGVPLWPTNYPIFKLDN